MIEASRARLHAALAEPHRLAIVDALALGDLSPTELAAKTGQASNLLAHHLGTLERAGAIRRRRSDADGRRTYLTLAWENPVVAATAAPTLSTRRAQRVVFVCSANSARSQMAASIMARTGAARVSSAGTSPASAIHPFALAELARHGLAPLAQTPTSAAEVLATGDLIVAVCDNAYEGMRDVDVDLHWSIPDPSMAGEDSFSRVFAELTPRVERLAGALTLGQDS